MQVIITLCCTKHLIRYDGAAIAMGYFFSEKFSKSHLSAIEAIHRMNLHHDIYFGLWVPVVHPRTCFFSRLMHIIFLLYLY